MDGFREFSYLGFEGITNALGLDANAQGLCQARFNPRAPRRHKVGGSSPSLRPAVRLPLPQAVNSRPRLEGYDEA